MESSWRTIKSLLRTSVAGALYISNLHRLLHKGKVTILTYHRVLSRNDLHKHWVQPGMYVETGVFEQHMQFLQEHFDVLSFHELLARWQRKDWDDNRRYCVITFDDGWLDNYQNAYPILRKHRIPATIFLPTNFVGTNEWFWPEKVSCLIKEMLSGVDGAQRYSMGLKVLAQFLNIDEARIRAVSPGEAARQAFADDIIERCKNLSPEGITQFISALASELQFAFPPERLVMNWEEVADMSGDGIAFGSHSCSHRILTKLPMDEVKAEVVWSQRVLQDRTRNYVPVFCYPNGNNNADIQTLVQECGYQAATGVQSGVEGRWPRNLFELRRVSIHNDMTSTVPMYSMRLFGPIVAWRFRRKTGSGLFRSSTQQFAV